MRVQRALKIRPGEGRIALRLLLLTVVLWVGTAVGANAVESLFFVRYGPEFLPYLYIAVGIVTFAVMTALNALMARSGGGVFVVLAQLVMAGVVVSLRALVLLPGRWIYPVMWLVMMIVWTVELFSVWTLAGAVHDTRQAKRLFPLYGAGLIVGGVVGGLVTGPLASWLGTENLLIAWAAALVAASLFARSIIRAAGATPRKRRRPKSSERGLFGPLAEGFHAVRVSSLLRWMAACLVLFALLYFSLALLFARAATARFPEADRLAGFLGLFMGASSGAGLLVSLVFANRLFARFGVATGVLILPLVYLAGFGVLVVQPAFAVLVVFRFVQMTWVNGVWATGWQALFNVVLPELRDRVRTFMDAIPLQVGMMASGVLLILAERVLRPRDVAFIGVGAAGLATLAMWRARRAYTGALVDALRAGNPEVFVAEEEPFGGFKRDARAREVVAGATSEDDPAVRRIAMEILAESGTADDMPSLLRGLRDADQVVRSAALRGVARSREPSAAVEVLPLLADPDGAVRSLAVDALVACSAPGEAASPFRSLLDDEDPRVRARAAAVLLRTGLAEEAGRVLEGMAASPRPEWRAEAISALGRAGHGRDVVAAGMVDPDPAVRLVAVSALGRFGPARSLDVLIKVLRDEDPGVREEAVKVIADAGPPAADRLIEALADPGLEAGAILALGRLPGANPDVLHTYAVGQADRAVHYATLLRGLNADGDERIALLAHALRHRSLEHALAALRAVSGLADPASMRLAIENLASGDPVQRANALETLEVLGDRAVVRPLLGVWEGDSGGSLEIGNAMLELLADPDPWLRACAAWAAASSDHLDVRSGLQRLARSDADTLVRETAARAMEGATVVEALPSLSLMERVVFLRRVPLFADLSPADLKHVAEVVSEHVYPGGEVIAEQGEPGEELYIVVEGEISVVVTQDGGRSVEVARRGVGDYVGEMSVISREPRMASLLCAGDVRTLAIDRKRFERILRERPDASLAMMRVLSSRLRESHGVGGSA
jgi:HEAT repeat protein